VCSLREREAQSLLKCQEAGSIIKSGGWEIVRNIDK